MARLTDWLNVTLIALAGPKIAQTNKKLFISSARGCEFLPRPHGVCFYLIPISESFSNFPGISFKESVIKVLHDLQNRGMHENAIKISIIIVDFCIRLTHRIQWNY